MSNCKESLKDVISTMEGANARIADSATTLDLLISHLEDDVNAIKPEVEWEVCLFKRNFRMYMSAFMLCLDCIENNLNAWDVQLIAGMQLASELPDDKKKEGLQS